MSASSPILYEVGLAIKNIDPDGKKFDRVSRIVLECPTDSSIKVLLDVAVDLYPLQIGRSINMKLTNSLDRGAGRMDEVSLAERNKDAWRLNGPSLADEADYVMHGKIYKYDETASTIVTAYGSFGGLLMALTAEADTLSRLTVGGNVFLLLK
ncbi:RNA polymerase [Ceraceosorus guamensis]|uniref:DNA-directed RNA polymerases I, II, and III subunit RPABC3 n=1 Tax=Ceraceosorus guamensis TaxID=1522189 RepID=A0A316VT17_9BASI|nr:RNA polymerase [Ceraceosorus guamensis]PWN40178.1 RNA polymerase [Ceraceosorus guamensis]